MLETAEFANYSGGYRVTQNLRFENRSCRCSRVQSMVELWTSVETGWEGWEGGVMVIAREWMETIDELALRRENGDHDASKQRHTLPRRWAMGVEGVCFN